MKRGNLLPHPRSRFLEYAVHGKWRRSQDDAKGVDGTWYIDVPALVTAFGAEVVEAKLAAYTAAQAAARAEAVAEAVAQVAAATEDAEDG